MEISTLTYICNCTLVSALTEAPAFSSIWTNSSCPLRHAMCSAVRPSCNVPFTRAMHCRSDYFQLLREHVLATVILSVCPSRPGTDSSQVR